MTRDEAIEAGALAIFIQVLRDLEPESLPLADAAWASAREDGDPYRREAAAVLDAIGWAEPRGYVIAVDDRDRPGTVYGGTWPDLDGARAWAERSERIWGLVPVEVGE